MQVCFIDDTNWFVVNDDGEYLSTTAMMLHVNKIIDSRRKI